MSSRIAISRNKTAILSPEIVNGTGTHRNDRLRRLCVGAVQVVVTEQTVNNLSSANVNVRTRAQAAVRQQLHKAKVRGGTAVNAQGTDTPPSPRNTNVPNADEEALTMEEEDVPDALQGGEEEGQGEGAAAGGAAAGETAREAEATAREEAAAEAEAEAARAAEQEAEAARAAEREAEAARAALVAGVAARAELVDAREAATAAREVAVARKEAAVAAREEEAARKEATAAARAEAAEAAAREAEAAAVTAAAAAAAAVAVAREDDKLATGLRELAISKSKSKVKSKGAAAENDEAMAKEPCETNSGRLATGFRLKRGPA